MPATSQAQQRAMAIEYDRRKRGLKPRRFTTMTMTQLHHYAETRGLRAKTGHK